MAACHANCSSGSSDVNGSLSCLLLAFQLTNAVAKHDSAQDVAVGAARGCLFLGQRMCDAAAGVVAWHWTSARGSLICMSTRYPNHLLSHNCRGRNA